MSNQPLTMGRHLRRLAIAAGLCLTASCQTTPEKTESAPAPPPEPVREFSKAPAAATVRILHTSDNESDILSAPGEAAGGIARAHALVQALRTVDETPTVVLAAGDTFMPAPELKVTVDDKNPVFVGNEMLGYQASALGNHEFDLGETFLADAIKQASFPYLGANLTFKGGPLAELAISPEGKTPWVEDMAGHVLKRGKVCAGKRTGTGESASCDGVVLGLVGSTTPSLRSISSVSDAVKIEDTFEATAVAVQRQVDALAAEGIHRVVLLSHFQGVEAEAAVAQMVQGVDIIIAGGGDNRLAEDGHRLLTGDERDRACEKEEGSCYPLVRWGLDDKPVLVVATDGQLRYLGRLEVGFDADGVLTGFDKDASLPLPIDDDSLSALGVTRDPAVLAFETKVADVLAPLTEPIANSATYLDGSREGVRNRETNFGDLAADSMMWAAQQNPRLKSVAFAVRNGGGIRAPIGSIEEKTGKRLGGPIRPIDVQSALRFDNQLVVVEASHAILKRAFESSLRQVGTSRGHFPQVSKEVELVYDPGRPEQTHEIKDGDIVGLGCPGSRVRSLKITAPDGTVVDVVKDGALPTPTAKLKFVTLSFLAEGGDGWFPGAQGRLRATPLTSKNSREAMREQQVLIDFIKAELAAGTWNDGASYPSLDEEQVTALPRIKRVKKPNTRNRPCP